MECVGTYGYDILQSSQDRRSNEKGNLWLIPIDAKKPVDGRTINVKRKNNGNT